MHRRHEVSDRLLQLAALQSHVVTREQAIGHGMSRHSISRLVESGSWRRLARGLFCCATRAVLDCSHGAVSCSVVNPRGSVRGRQVTYTNCCARRRTSSMCYYLISGALRFPVHGTSSVKEQEYARRVQSRIRRDSALNAPCSI